MNRTELDRALSQAIIYAARAKAAQGVAEKKFTAAIDAVVVARETMGQAETASKAAYKQAHNTDNAVKYALSALIAAIAKE